jgi:hypothetical protein
VAATDALPDSLSGSSAKMPIARKPPQHSTITPAVDNRMTLLMRRLFATGCGAVGSCHDGREGGLVTGQL